MSQFPTTERGVRRNANNIPITYGESPASGPAPTTAGHHQHDMLNKLDPRVDSTQDRRPLPQENHVPAGTYGPHRSRIANILDPRVDSDMDHRGAAAAAPRHNTAAGVGTGPAMHGGLAPGAGTGTSAPEGTYGPHSSRIANALDPRVDSDLDNRARLGGAGTGAGAVGGGGYPTGAAAAGAMGPGYGPGPVGPGGAGAPGGVGQQHLYPGQNQHYPQQQEHGMYAQPHGAAVGGGPGHHQHHHQTGTGTGPTGALGRNPEVSGGPGPAPNTAGPHRSDLLNKLDPRVDSKTGITKQSATTERRGI